MTLLQDFGVPAQLNTEWAELAEVEQVAIGPACTGCCLLTTCKLRCFRRASRRVLVEGPAVLGFGECFVGNSASFSLNCSAALMHTKCLARQSSAQVPAVHNHTWCSQWQGPRINCIPSLPSCRSLPLVTGFSSALPAACPAVSRGRDLCSVALFFFELCFSLFQALQISVQCRACAR